MNELMNESSDIQEVLKRTGKVIGGLVLGATAGYAMSKGIVMIIPIESQFTDLYEGTVTASLALGGAFIANEIAE
ncbi:hypothetical protein KC968_04070 [Candidatus Saccharibacteria bacterium]|nr:hypothetical protein [Candidatus Saccharibacteria bacterium]